MSKSKSNHKTGVYLVSRREWSRWTASRRWACCFVACGHSSIAVMWPQVSHMSRTLVELNRRTSSRPSDFVSTASNRIGPHRTAHRTSSQPTTYRPEPACSAIEWQNYPKFRCLQLIMILIPSDCDREINCLRFQKSAMGCMDSLNSALEFSGIRLENWFVSRLGFMAHVLRRCSPKMFSEDVLGELCAISVHNEKFFRSKFRSNFQFNRTFQRAAISERSECCFQNRMAQNRVFS